MKLKFKGKFKGDYNVLPSDELEKHPNAVPFKECKNIKLFMVIMNIAALIPMILLFILFIKLSGMDNFSIAGYFASIISMVPHEILHAVCFTGEVHMYVTGGGMFVACSQPLSKGRFIFMSMLPNIVFGFIPLIIFLINPSLGFFGSMAMLTIPMGMGDYYNVFNALTQVPKGGMCFNHKQESYWYVDNM